MSAPSLRLVEHGKPRRLSGVEIQAMTKERMDALKARRAAESEARAAAQAAWRKEGARSARCAYWTFVVAYIALVYGALWLLWPR